MKLEIERKFLLTDQSWRASIVSSSKLADGLLFDRNGTKVCVRIEDERGLITIEGPKVGMSRPELECEIPLADAKYMLLNLCGGNVCRRIRYLVSDEAHAWYVDVYQDIVEGFVIGEIEFTVENEVFALPDWLGEQPGRS